MSRPPLTIRDVVKGEVNFCTSGPFVWIDVAQLDSARLTIRRYGVAYIHGNGIDEADVVMLHQAIRGASQREALR